MREQEEFRPPEIDGRQVYRQRIASALDEAKGKGGHWVYLSAPGGFGKTVAVSQWLAPQKNKLAWITLNDRDNDEGTFVRRFLEAISFAQRANKKLNREANRTSPPFIEHLFRSLSLLLDNDKSYVVVLDDFHYVTNRKILDVFPTLMKLLPKAITLCFIGRGLPDDAFLDDIIKDNITVISAKELAFDDMELKSVLSNSEVKHDSKEVMSRTGGWPIAVRALAMRSQKLAEPGIGSIQEDMLFRYLDLHVWQRWNEETREFFMNVSLVPELDERICRHITGASNSSELLEDFYFKGSFMNAIGRGKYRLHDLFRDFLVEKLHSTKTMEDIKKLQKRTADFFYQEGDYCSATSLYVRCGDLQGIADCSAAFTAYDPTVSIEARIDFFKKNILDNPHVPIEENLHLSAQSAFIRYAEGDPDGFISSMDKLYRSLDLIDDPKLKVLVYILRCLDFRIPLEDYAQDLIEGRADNMPQKGTMRTGTFTAAMPILHRSLRERSELAQLPEKLSQNLEKLFVGLSPLFGYEHETMLHCQRAGILYEQNRLNEAYSSALEGHRSAVKKECRPELSFCARMILIAILKAMGRKDETNILGAETERWIEEDGLLFLIPNFRAWQFRERIEAGDVDAGREWLRSYSIPLMGKLPLYKMYQHFTTMRALIATGSSALGVMFGEKLLQLGRDFRRPSDVVEVSILLSIANWNLGDREKSLRHMEEALNEAERYLYYTMFLEEGKWIRPVVESYLKISKQAGIELSNFAMTVAVAVMERSADKENNVSPQPVSLTDREMLTLRLLSQNLSYKRIAQELGVSHSTAKYHVLKLYRSLGATCGSEALVKAKQMGYI